MSHKVPSNLKATLAELEGTISEWENISIRSPSLESHDIEDQKESLQKEARKKAQNLLEKLKDQIDELSE